MKKIPLTHLILVAGVALVLAWSAWQPYDRLTWWLEVFPALAALVVLFATYRRFQFTTLTYILIALHMCVLFVGGHYTYARVPLSIGCDRSSAGIATITIGSGISCKALFLQSSRGRFLFTCSS